MSVKHSKIGRFGHLTHKKLFGGRALSGPAVDHTAFPAIELDFRSNSMREGRQGREKGKGMELGKRQGYNKCLTNIHAQRTSQTEQTTGA